MFFLRPLGQSVMHDTILKLKYYAILGHFKQEVSFCEEYSGGLSEAGWSQSEMGRCFLVVLLIAGRRADLGS